MIIEAQMLPHEECEINQKEELEWTKHEVSKNLYEESTGNVN